MSEIPVDFLANCSTQSIEDLMLSRENEAANHRKALRIVIDQFIEAAVEAAFARWMLKNREAVRQSVESQVNVIDGRSAGRGISEELCLPEDRTCGTRGTSKVKK